MRGVGHLRDERGQALVILVVVVSAAALLVQVVTDAGLFLGAQRQTQSIADAAALAAVQEFPAGDPVARGREYAELNSPGVNVDVDPNPSDSSVEVTISRDVPGMFGFLAGEVRVRAEARAGAPTTLDNEELQLAARPGAQSWVTPLVLHENVCGGAVPWPTSCFGQSLRLVLTTNSGGGGDDDDDDDEGGGGSRSDSSTFGIADLACARRRGGCTNPDAGEVAGWLECDPCLSGEVELANMRTAPDGLAVGEALVRLVGQTLIVPVYGSFQGNRYRDIQGFAAFVLTNVVLWTEETKVIEGWLDTFTAADSSRVEAGSINFGVQAFALTR